MDLPQNSIQQLRRMSLALKTVGFISFFGILFMQVCWLAYTAILLTYNSYRFYQSDIVPVTIILLGLLCFQIIGSQLWLSGQNFSKYLKSLDVQFLNKGFKHLRWFWFCFGIIALILLLLILALILYDRLRRL